MCVFFIDIFFYIGVDGMARFLETGPDHLGRHLPRGGGLLSGRDRRQGFGWPALRGRVTSCLLYVVLILIHVQ